MMRDLRAMGAGAPSLQRGFTIVTGIFLLVVLVSLGAFIASVSTMQNTAAGVDSQGAQAYQAARAGIDWAAYQVLDPNNVLNPASCAVPVMPTCPAATNLTGLAGTLSGYTTSVTCTASDTTEGTKQIRVFSITSTACNMPDGGGACPNAQSKFTYTERQVSAVLSKCANPSGTAPRCSCGS